MRNIPTSEAIALWQKFKRLRQTWTDAYRTEVAAIRRQYTIDLSSFGDGGDQAVHQSQIEILEFCVNFDRANEIGGKGEFVLVSRCRVEDFRDQLAHRLSFGSQEIVHFGEYQTRHDHTVKMRLLLLLGADANAKDETESTPLMGAAWRGQTDAVKMLLEHGANLNARNKSGETPLILAAKEGHTEIIRLLLDRNPDVNAKDNDGWTCLMWAAWNGYTETVKMLLNTGVRVSARNNAGETAEFLAAKKLHSDIAALLRAAE